MVRRRLGQSESQKLPQRKRIRQAPPNPAFRIDSFKVAEQKHPEVNPGNHARPTHHRFVKPFAQMLQAFVELVPLQDLVDLGVERMTCRPGDLPSSALRSTLST